MLGSLPAVDEVLQCAELSDMRKSYSHAIFVQWVRVAIQQVRSQILSGHVPFADDFRVSIVQHVRELGQSDKHRTIGTVINATGVILHTNLGRAPLSSLALERMRNASAYTNLEFDLESGKRCRRAARLEEMLSKLTGAEDAMVVNNCAAATILVLQTLAFGLEVIISRGQMVEIGGGFRLPDVFRIAGVILREVGTTNRTYCRDYEEAIGPNTGAIIRVHHSNFGQVGFVTSPELKEIVAIERRNDLPIIDDLGSGNLYELSKYGLNEPTVIDSLKA